jgi:hypothetical protein
VKVKEKVIPLKSQLARQPGRHHIFPCFRMSDFFEQRNNLLGIHIGFLYGAKVAINKTT